MSTYNREYYLANRDKFLARQREYNRAHREQRNAARRAYYRANREKVLGAQRERLKQNAAYLQLKKSKPCADCGSSFPAAAMDFHHVGDDKSFGLASVGGRSRTTIDREIAKCILLCANCHRIRTANGN